jgi:hypothetical protein
MTWNHGWAALIGATIAGTLTGWVVIILHCGLKPLLLGLLPYAAGAIIGYGVAGLTERSEE